MPLQNWEIDFVERGRQLLEHTPIVELKNCRMVLYLLEKFSPDFVTEHMKQILNSPTRIIRYLEHTIATWTGAGVSYEVQNGYQKYVSEQRILDAIEQCKRDRSLYKEKKQTQFMCAVFVLNHDKVFTVPRQVSIKEADNLLEKWKAERATNNS